MNDATFALLRAAAVWAAIVLSLAACGSTEGGDEQLLSGAVAPDGITDVDSTEASQSDSTDQVEGTIASDGGGVDNADDGVEAEDEVPTSSQDPAAIEPISVEGTVLSESYTEPAGWGGLQFSFRNIVQTTYEDGPAISAEFFAKSVVEDEGRFGVELLSLVEPGVTFPTPAVALTDRTGSFGDTFVVPGDQLFYGVAFFPVETEYADATELVIRVGTFDLVYSDVRLDGSPFDEPDYPVFVDLDEVEALVLSGSGLLGVDCTTAYTMDQSVVISSSDPLRYYPAPHNTRFVLVETQVVPVATPDPLCPSTDVVAEAFAPVLTSDAGEASASVSEAELSALPGSPEAAAYLGLWRIPATTTELTITPSHPDAEAVIVEVQLDLYDSELAPVKTLEESEAERNDG